MCMCVCVHACVNMSAGAHQSHNRVPVAGLQVAVSLLMWVLGGAVCTLSHWVVFPATTHVYFKTGALIGILVLPKSEMYNSVFPTFILVKGQDVSTVFLHLFCFLSWQK